MLDAPLAGVVESLAGGVVVDELGGAVGGGGGRGAAAAAAHGLDRQVIDRHVRSADPRVSRRCNRRVPPPVEGPGAHPLARWRKVTPALRRDFS